MSVEKFFFYFENVATRGKKPEERVVELLGFLVGEAFHFYYDEYATDGSLSEAGQNYAAVKKAFIERFGKVEAPEEKIQMAVSASLDPADLISSLKGMDNLFQKAGFDDNAKFGLLRKAVMEQAELSQYIMFNNPVDYKSLKKAIHSFVSAKEAFSFHSSTASFVPRKIIQRPDVGQRKIEDKVDALASQLSQLSLIIKKSQTSEKVDSDSKPCSYCCEPGHYATNCPKNEHRNTRCLTCGKLGNPESCCFKKHKKEDNGANVVITDGDTIEESDTHNTVGVNLVENSGSNSNEDVVASVKRAANGEALPKQARPNGIIPISSLLTPKTIPPATKSKAKKAKNKGAARREGISDYAGKYDVISELANASTGLTFGQLIRGDGEKAKSEIRRLLTRGTRVRRNVAAAVPGSSLTVRPRRLKVVQIKTFGTDAEALLDSGAVPNLISEKLCKKLSVDFNKKHIGLTVADGQRAHSIGTITDVPISFDDLHISMDFYVMKNPPFEVIIGVPLRGQMIRNV